MAKTAKKAAKKPAKKSSATKLTEKKMAAHKVAAARAKVAAKKPTKGKAAGKAPNPQQVAKLAAAQEKVAEVYAKATAAGAAKAAAEIKKPKGSAFPIAPAVHDFAQAFKEIIGNPKRTAAQLLGDDPKPFNGVTLKELVTVFVADNKRLGELTMAAKQAGCDPQAFTMVAVLSLPYMRETRAAVELYLKVLAE